MNDNERIEKLENELKQANMLLGQMILNEKEKININVIDKWLENKKGMSYTELKKQFDNATTLMEEYDKRIHNIYKFIDDLWFEGSITQYNANRLQRILMKGEDKNE